MKKHSFVEITERGQVTLPKWIRERMQLKGGENFVPEQDGENIMLRRFRIDIPQNDERSIVSA